MYDVIILGGSYAGLAVAMPLARARRRVLIIDAGERPNRFAASSHGFFGQDGKDPAAIAALGRAEILAYPTMTWLEGTATGARGTTGEFIVTATGQDYRARSLVLALGVKDELPKIPGLRERWGKSVFHCPFCHGYELNQGKIAVLATMPSSEHHGLMLPDWGPTTYFTNGQFEPEHQAVLAKRGVTIVSSSLFRRWHRWQVQLRPLALRAHEHAHVGAGRARLAFRGARLALGRQQILRAAVWLHVWLRTAAHHDEAEEAEKESAHHDEQRISDGRLASNT